MSSREIAIAKATGCALPDGVFWIVCHNRYKRPSSPEYIDPLDIFPAEPPDVIADWVSRSQTLLSKNYRVGEAFFVGKGDGDKVRQEFIEANPGFSEEAYEHAIYLGVSAAVH